MLQTTLLEDVASHLATAEKFATLKIGTSGTQPTRDDGGLKGTELVAATVTVEQDGAIVRVQSAEFEFNSGTAQEIAFFRSDGECMDRLIFPPIVGGVATKLSVEYLLEPVANV